MLIEEITEKNYKEKVPEGEERVRKKLQLWKNQGKQGIPNLYLLFDPTIWAYSVLKDKQGKPLVLRGFQDRIINDRKRFVIATAANQIGKTWSGGCVKGLHHAIHVPNATVLIISRSEPQAVRILDEMKWMMRRADIRFDTIMGDVENRTELHIPNYDGKGVSTILCLPPTTAVLSYPATLVICDESGFWDVQTMSQERYFYQIVETRTNETKNWTNDHFTMGQIVLISNPNGQRGILWRVWRHDKRFNKYRYCWLANPQNTIEEYKERKMVLPSDVFDSSYAAVFSSASGGFITGQEYADAIKEEYEMTIPMKDTLYLGADFAGEDTVGRDVDDTVMMGAVRIDRKDEQPKIKIVYENDFGQRAPKNTVIYPEIKRLKKMYSVGMFGYDKQGVGDSVKNDLIDKAIFPEYMIEPLTYSLPNKSEVYYNMKHLFEQRRVMLPDIPKLKEQLMGLRFDKTDAGHIKVHHKKEGLHDDYADALANCLYMATRYGSGISVGFVEIPDRNKTKEKKHKGPRTAILCKSCKMNKYSSEPKTGYCDECL